MFTKLTRYFYKNQIITYGNIGQISYTAEWKEQFLNACIDYTKQIHPNMKLKFDIGGVGIGLSKGAPFIGEKGLRSRIEKFGINRLESLIVYISEIDFTFHWSIWPKLETRDACLYSCVTWPYATILPLEETIEHFSFLSKYFALSYGFYNRVSRSTNSTGGWKTNLVGTSYRLKEDWNWDQKIESINSGTIRNKYPINCLNSVQLEKNKHLFTSISELASTNLWICIP